MNNKDNVMETPEIHDGGVVEIFACKGQCRGQDNSIAVPDFSATPITKAS